MHKITRIFGLLGVCLAASAANAADTAALLVYQVMEPGLDPYVSRYLVNSRYLRLDEGGGLMDGYTLFDRREGVIYNVSLEDQSVLVMNPPAQLPPPPADLQIRKKVEVDEQAPLISGQRPTNVTLLANEVVCVEMVAVEGLMGEAVKALMEFRRVLARVQGAIASSLPEDSNTACDLAEHVHAASHTLEYGLPIREGSSNMTKSLLDFNPSFEVTADLFRLPEDYRRIPMPGLSVH